MNMPGLKKLLLGPVFMVSDMYMDPKEAEDFIGQTDRVPCSYVEAESVSTIESKKNSTELGYAGLKQFPEDLKLLLDPCV